MPGVKVDDFHVVHGVSSNALVLHRAWVTCVDSCAVVHETFQRLHLRLINVYAHEWCVHDPRVEHLSELYAIIIDFLRISLALEPEVVARAIEVRLNSVHLVVAWNASSIGKPS